MKIRDSPKKQNWDIIMCVTVYRAVNSQIGNLYVGGPKLEQECNFSLVQYRFHLLLGPLVVHPLAFHSVGILGHCGGLAVLACFLAWCDPQHTSVKLNLILLIL